MNTLHRLWPAALLLALTALLLTACSRDDLAGPPELRLGRDICAECNMLVAEDRCSSAILIEDRGRRDHRMFDDISCMIDFEDKDHDFVLIETFVRDYAAGEENGWLSAADAYFLHADVDRLRTPMGSGMVAFATRSAAEAKQQEVGGEIMTWEELSAARREAMRSR